MKNHEKRSENQQIEDRERELTIKYPAVNLGMAKASSERGSLSLHRCTRSLTLGVLALIVSLGIGLIPGPHPILSPATAFAQPEPQGVCAGCGRKIGTGHEDWCPYNPNRYKGTPKGTKPLSLPQMGGLMVMQGLLNGLFADLNQDLGGAQQQAEAAKQAQLQAWMAQEQRRLTAMVAQQRVKRDQEDKTSMEEMAKAMGSGFDTPTPNSDLASALSDPNVVDLRGYGDKPLVVKNLKGDENPGGTPFFGSGGGSASLKEPAREAQLRTQATKKLQEMTMENRNPKKLDQRLQKLEEDLANTMGQAKELQNKINAGAKDYDLYEKSVDSAVKDAEMRGLRLLVDLGGDRLLGRLDDVRSKQPEKWNRTLQALDKINNCAMVASKIEQYGITSGDVYDKEWEVFTRSKVDHKKDIDFILQNLPDELFNPYSLQYKLGKSILNNVCDTTNLFVELKGLNRTTDAYTAQQKLIGIKIKAMVKAIKERREQLAKEKDV